METLHADRLMKLARFLYRLPPEKFNFAVVLQGQDIPNDTFQCGTVGCAIGWMPMVFPERFEWRAAGAGRDQRIGLFDKESPYEVGNGNFIGTAESFFDLLPEEASGLFSPGYQQYVEWNDVDSHTSPKEVAMMIASFVKRESPQTDTEFTGLFY
jgi:hypothetical protein